MNCKHDNSIYGCNLCHAEQRGVTLIEPPTLGVVTPMHRTGDKRTSIAAAKALTEERLTELQTLVLAYFRRVKDATDEELEDALMAEVPAASTLRKRRGDLVRLGHLQDSGRTRPNRNVRQMIVWELADQRVSVMPDVEEL